MNTSVTIAAGQSLSPVIDLMGRSLARIFVPSGWDAADITAQVSADGATYVDYYDDLGEEVTIAAAASRAIVVPPLVWDEVRFLRLRSGTSGDPVPQADAVTLVLATLNRV